MSEKPLFVTGTDTDVGKTVLSLLIMKCFFRKGRRPVYLKPFQTGCSDPSDRDSDAAFIYRNLPELKGADQDESVIVCLQEPKAPFFAARDQDVSIDVDGILEKIRSAELQSDPLVIEGAGGLFVPVTQDTMIIDMIKKTGASPVLAARAGLGTINHTLLSIHALKMYGCPEPGIVLINSPEERVSGEMIRENIEAVEGFSGIRVAGVIESVADFSQPPESVFNVIESLIQSIM